jgi:hypothetical protein
MALIPTVLEKLFRQRQKEIYHFCNNPAEVQRRELLDLIEYAADTEFGKTYDFKGIDSIEKFQRRVPVCDYDSFYGYFDRARQGEKNVIWPTPIRWFAKSSGTTSNKSKFIPVSRESLRDSHLRGPRDLLGMFATMYPETKVFNGKFMTLGGSHRIERVNDMASSGDLSAIMIDNTPWWASMSRLPKVDTALIPDFEHKIERICRETISKNVTSIAGAPSWNLVLLQRILEYTGKNNILEVWPNMELFMHGGMGFEPYRSQFEVLIPTDNMKYVESYNASEGFFAIQNEPTRRDMLLMLDYGIFYEFLPTDSLNDYSKAVSVADVKLGVNYAVIITTSAGLWRYMIGDTVRFTSKNPYKFVITGRTKHFINVFGEELIVDNAEQGLAKACAETGAQIADYTAAPVYMDSDAQCRHQWLIEFSRRPESIEQFATILDTTLQQINSDYEAKRYKDITMQPLEVIPARANLFNDWLKSKGKLGGQHKVPRLSNSRDYISEMLEMNK